MPNSGNSEHRAMGWAAIGGALMGVGALAGISLGVWAAGSHLWSDVYFLAGFVAALVLTLLGFYVLIAEFIGGAGPVSFPLPPTRLERAQRRSRIRENARYPKRSGAEADHEREQRLVALYREGEQARARILLSGALIAGDLLYGRASQRQVEREQWARDWDRRVLDALADDARPKWAAAGTLPASKLDYVTTIAGVRTFLAEKLACLREIISGSGADQSKPPKSELTSSLAHAEIKQCELRPREPYLEQAISTGENFARLILQAQLQRSGRGPTAESRRQLYNLAASVDAWGQANRAPDQAPRYSGDVSADLDRLQVFVATELARLRTGREGK